MDSTQIDSYLKSAMVGRIAGGILMIAAIVAQAYGGTLTAEDQKGITEAISLLAGSIGTILVFASKIREMFKAKK